MVFISRKIESKIEAALERGKSVLLLGPRQTGKTTLIRHSIKPDIQYNFTKVSTRQRYEQDPALLEKEVEEKIGDFDKRPIIFIDEIQKIPEIMDIAQHLIDDQAGQFILSGSSARKLKHGAQLNFLPGRVVNLHMSPLLHEELGNVKLTLEDLLLYGGLPNIITDSNKENREIDLLSYVSTYIEEEVRAEALVRNVGAFARFLKIAAAESGKQLNFSKLSQNIGVQDTTIKNYYQILEDCLIVHRIDPITKSQTKRRLIKSPKYLFFDLGVKRACENIGTRLPLKIMSDLFEQFVGIELIGLGSIISAHIKVRYWRDSAGDEVDYVIETADELIPIEVKWSDKPNLRDARHLCKFLDEYPSAKRGYVICRTPDRYKISDNIIALPWQEISSIASPTKV